MLEIIKKSTSNKIEIGVMMSLRKEKNLFNHSECLQECQKKSRFTFSRELMRDWESMHSITSDLKLRSGMHKVMAVNVCTTLKQFAIEYSRQLRTVPEN
jgi:hypothetical protein